MGHNMILLEVRSGDTPNGSQYDFVRSKKWRYTEWVTVRFC